MITNQIRDQKSVDSSNRIQFLRKTIFIYVIFAVALPVFCLFLGWRALDDIGTGFIFGSLCLLLFGTLTLFGSTVPAQLSKLALPKYRPPSTELREETKNDGSVTISRGKELFLTSLVCSALLVITGLILKIF